MLSISDLNTLMVFEELLNGPKSAKELRFALMPKRRKRREIPMLLPHSIEDFLEIHAGRGTLKAIPSEDGHTKYEVDPHYVASLRSRIERAFVPEILGQFSSEGGEGPALEEQRIAAAS